MAAKILERQELPTKSQSNIFQHSKYTKSDNKIRRQVSRKIIYLIRVYRDVIRFKVLPSHIYTLEHLCSLCVKTH